MAASMKISMIIPLIHNRIGNILVGLVLNLIFFLPGVQANGNQMADFENLRNVTEKIVRERAYEPMQLAEILSTSFEMTDDELPNHFRYRANIENNELFVACDLRAPKTDRAKNAILVCDLNGNSAKAADINAAYGESVEFRPARPSSPLSRNYMSIKFDNAELSFGFDQSKDNIKTVVIKFDL